jgi:DNA mismatch repair protein MutS
LSDSIKNIDPCQELCNELQTRLTQVPPTGPGSEPSINRGINPEIDDHRSFLESIFLKLVDLEESERARTGMAIKVGYNRVFGYYLECPRGQAAQAPDDYEPRQTLANAQRFRFLPLTALEKDISVTQGLLVNLEQDIIAELVELVSKYEAELSQISNAVAVVDVATGLAEIAEKNSYCRPIFNDKNKIEIQSGRHPVVENSMSAGEFVPNNTHLGPPAEKIILLTGPNMAGKSTYLRQLAIIVLMAHCGSFVSAKSANLPVVDRIFSRVGSQDEIAAGRSTFMVEMTETATILNNCTQDSLVIFDEVGRGTSTEDGLAIAQAVIEFLYDNDKGCPLTVFATHYRELTNITAHLDGVINRSVAVSNEDGVITFLHRIINGSADSSYGVHVASLAGIPKEVIQRAQLLLETPQVEQKPYSNVDKHPGKPEKQQLSGDLDAMIRKLKRIAPDSLTPREALEKLYELREEADQL